MISDAVRTAFRRQCVDEIQSRERQINREEDQLPVCGEWSERLTPRSPEALLNRGGQNDGAQGQQDGLIDHMHGRHEKYQRAQAGRTGQKSEGVFFLFVQTDVETTQQQLAESP